jgi:2-oxoglutarate ferredoxin oxidoreductase subunit beta
MPPTAAPSAPAVAPISKKDFETDQEVRWCPGCGDYAILNAAQTVFAKIGIPREKLVVVSGIGCSSRFPYYVNAYGFHSIHGRAPAVATGVKSSNPDLQVWVITGDGDGLSIGGNHLLHAMRRNIDLKIILFNNRIYGLTKGQFSPTSELGKINKSAPFGTIDRPIDPICFALAAGATFVARSVDVYAKHLQDVLARAAHHKGAAFVEVYQNCNVFNDGAFKSFTEREARDQANLLLEHGKPLRFGKNGEKAIRVRGSVPEVVNTADVHPEEIAIHDERTENPAWAFTLARMAHPAFPVPLGVFHVVQEDTWEQRLHAQIAQVREQRGEGDLDALLNAGDTWDVK